MTKGKSFSRLSFPRFVAAASALMLAAFMVVSLSAPVRAQATQNKIAFSRDAQLWTMNGDGSGQTDLGLAAQGFDPSWSPDGKKIAYTCGYEHWNICVIGADGTNPVQLTFGGGDTNPAWSPDGKKILYTSGGGSEPHIYLMNPDGSGQQRLFINDTSILSEYGAVWSPDGTRVAFVGVTQSVSDPESYDSNIYTAKVDGSEPPALVVADASYESELAWSPDGTKLAYTRMFGESVIHFANLNGTPSGMAPLTDGEHNSSPSWSPDGSQLAFYRRYVFEDENGDPVSIQEGIYVLQVSTGLVTSLNAPGGSTPAYRPAVSQPEPPPPAGPAERIQNLIGKVESYGLPYGTTNSLTVKLRHALDALNAGDTATACARLADFINQARALSGKKLTVEQSTQLRDEAASIRAALGCQ